MIQKSELVTLLSDAYRHLYDLVYLGNCPAADLFFSDLTLRRKDKAWQLQHILLDAIEALNSIPNAPVFSRAWRRYRLMVMHYVDGTDPKTIAEQLNISRRHYYREHDHAIESIAEALLQRLVAVAPPAITNLQLIDQSSQQTTPTDRSNLLRAEIARSTQTNQRTHLSEAVQSAIKILHEQLEVHKIRVEYALHNLPDVAIDRGLLRHILMSATQYLTKTNDGVTLGFNADLEGEFVRLRVTVSGINLPQATVFADAQVQLAAIREIADMSNVGVEYNFNSLTFTLPVVPKHTVLIIDDNHDLAGLFQSWLDQRGYSTVVAHSAREGIELATEINPFAVTLDLMMPDQDGWDVLQILSTQPNTSHIPVIVCSVLRQEDLALSLGASAFLLKPITRHDLLSRLEELQARYPVPSGPTEPRSRV